MAGAVIQPVLPLSGGQGSCRVNHSSHLGSHHCQSRPRLPRETPGWSQTLGDRPFSSRSVPGPSACSGASLGGTRDGVSPATWWLPGSSGGPSWSEATPVNPGASPGVTPVCTVRGRGKWKWIPAIAHLQVDRTGSSEINCPLPIVLSSERAASP